MNQIAMHLLICMLRAPINSKREIERLEGLVPVVEDWQARIALLKVSFNTHIITITKLINILVLYRPFGKEYTKHLVLMIELFIS